MVQFDPSTDSAGKAETAKWVLLATDREMTNDGALLPPVRLGDDRRCLPLGLQPLGDRRGPVRQRPAASARIRQGLLLAGRVELGRRQAEVKSAVRAFAIDAERRSRRSRMSAHRCTARRSTTARPQPRNGAILVTGNFF